MRIIIIIFMTILVVETLFVKRYLHKIIYTLQSVWHCENVLFYLRSVIFITHDSSSSYNWYNFPYWTPNNPINDYARINSINLGGANVWIPKSYVRVQNIALGYNLPSDLLENLKIKGSLVPSDNKITDLKIADYLVDIPPSEDMDYQQALTLAMHREQASVNLYKMLASLAPNDEVQDIFFALVEEEAHHKVRLEDEYDENILRDN